MGFLKFPSVVGVGALSAAVSFAVVAQQAPSDEPPPALVKVAVAEAIIMAPTIWVPGTVVSRDDARVAAEVDGRLVMVAEIGAGVARGEAIARIDDTELRLEKAEADAVVVRERARLSFAEQELKRLRGLEGKGLITRNRLDEARSARDAARAERGAARARLDLIEDRLSRTVVSAPFDGVVTDRFRRPGERVEEGDEILRVVNPASVEVVVRVSPASLPHMNPGNRISVRGNNQSVVSELRSVVPIGDDLSRLYDVRLVLDDSPWPAGTTLRVAVPTASPREVIAVPRDALVLRRSGTSVFRVNGDDIAEQLSVQTGVASGAAIEVVGDIRPGDRVVIRGAERLRSGQAVQILPD